MAKQPQLHSRIKQDIVDKIESGYYPSGSLLPTESEFCKMYDVSRTTLRTALNHLLMEGAIYRKQGKGTFVAKGKVKQILSSSNLRYADQLKAQGIKPKIKVVDLQKLKPSKKIQNRLGIDGEQMVYQVKRIRYADEEEIQFETAFIRADLVPEITEEMANISLYQCINSQGNTIKRTEEQIKIFISDEEIAQHLNITQGTPCFQIATQTFLASEEVVEFSLAYFRGDRVEFFIERDYEERGV
ncbi:GntR family transcriptional regulator [Bacillus swezeyi]|uniref:GntR family transcriptional regulator n=1 Tax=Bacillus swezeyi TaxID=1925020 RepID=UPI00123B7480|nr:GntR family transcriptional regulator [Bacillus swezeyi]KAA6474216.1 GntR family transcriptional regulator [Bacillus swezeyi]